MRESITAAAAIKDATTDHLSDWDWWYHQPHPLCAILFNTPFVPSFSTPSTVTWLRTRELHGPAYYHVGSPVDPGYEEQMRAMYGREEVD